MMQRKKAQVQLGESLFVVIIIVLLIVFGIVFYSGVEKDSLTDELSGFDDLETIAIAQYVTSLTELQCSLENVEYATCFDRTKLFAFRTVVDEQADFAKEFYFSQLGNARLDIVEIYPSPENDRVAFVLYENKLYSTTPPTTKQSQVTLPVSILNPVTDTYSFAILTLIQYHK